LNKKKEAINSYFLVGAPAKYLLMYFIVVKSQQFADHVQKVVKPVSIVILFFITLFFPVHLYIDCIFMYRLGARERCCW
jgi:hypothetical protein